MKPFSFQKISYDCNSFAVTKKQSHALFQSLMWVVLEKVNGSNFSVYCDGQEVAFAKRSDGFLQPGDWFYGYESISLRLTEQIQTLYRLAKDTMSLEFAYIILTGELCGGFYPRDAKAWQGPVQAGRINQKSECILPLEQRAVQEGVYYSPDLEFVPFALRFIDKLDQEVMPPKMDYTRFMALCQQVGLSYLKPLDIGTYQYCLKFNPEFDSRVATELFGQEPLPKGTNLAEGIVMMPMDMTVRVGPVRPMVKRKQSAFVEISGDFSKEQINANVILVSMINNVRLNALLSKMGLPNEQTVDLLLEDAWVDFYQTCPTLVVKNQQEAQQLMQVKAEQLVEQFRRRLS